MAAELVPGWLPPSRENWELVVRAWQYFPLLTAVQYLTSFYPQGKTSIESRFNLPGKWAWFAMEIPGTMTLLYCCLTIPARTGLASASGLDSWRALPIGNKTMAGMFAVHYLYRAVLAPLFLNPSMSPIHPIVAVSAAAWQVANGLSLGGWLGGYGPTSHAQWMGRDPFIMAGLVLWALGLLGNMFHDDDLREIRRSAVLQQATAAEAAGDEAGNGASKAPSAAKVYKIPKNGLFRYVLYAHYLCEWVEWAGYWMVGGLACIPARSFVFNEVATMLPRAVQGRQWYISKFGADKVGGRKAVIPGII